MLFLMSYDAVHCLSFTPVIKHYFIMQRDIYKKKKIKKTPYKLSLKMVVGESARTKKEKKRNAATTFTQSLLLF